MAKALTRLQRATEISETRPDLVLEAREEGATWEQIAEAAHVSRATAINMANARRASRQ